jgi:hypothetical protein
MAVNYNPPIFEKDNKDANSELFSLEDIFDEFLFKSDRPQPPVNVRDQNIIAANVPQNAIKDEKCINEKQIELDDDHDHDDDDEDDEDGEGRNKKKIRGEQRNMSEEQKIERRLRYIMYIFVIYIYT